MLRFGVGVSQSGEDPDIRQLEEQIARTGQQIEMLKQRRRERLAGAGGGQMPVSTSRSALESGKLRSISHRESSSSPGPVDSSRSLETTVR